MNEHVTLSRDLEALAGHAFDVLVVGGGIHGLAVAYDAAQRGLSTALVERGDFGGAASFNHQKTAHGGLRSLQTGDLRRARESVLERRTLARIAPRLLRPLPFLIGTYRSLMRSRLALSAAFRIDRLVARDRNDGVEPELCLPAPRLISRAAALRLFPGIRTERLTGGAMWYDYQIVETDRLTIGFALAAAAHGALLANHVEAIGALREGSRVTGCRVRDRLTHSEFDIRARLTINAAGSRAGLAMGWFGVTDKVPLLKAMNLVTSRSVADVALASPTHDGRMLTLTPWRGIAIVGTSQSSTFVSPEDESPTASEVSSFIADANEAFPALNVDCGAVTLVHRGIVPAERGRSGSAVLKRHPSVLDHEREGVQGALSLIGVKYTTARASAARAVDVCVKKLGKAGSRAETAKHVLPGASIADHEALAIDTERRARVRLSDASRAHLTALYGARCGDVIEMADGEAALAEPLASTTAAIGAEVIHAIRRESARHLDDVLMRRCTIGAGSWPGDEAVARAADIAARELHWSDAQRLDEISALRDRYFRER